jgi:hypothetical protein
MLLILRSTARSFASTSVFPVCGASVMDEAREPATVVVVPLDTDPVEDPAPLEFAVPAELVPGGVGDATFEALPAPLGSLTALFKPPALPGPEGTPLIAEFPAPAEPALGEPAALPVPAVAPLAAPPALPPLTPAPCANAPSGDIKSPITASAAGVENLVMEKLLSNETTASAASSASWNEFRMPRLNVGLGYVPRIGGAAHHAQADRL